MTLRWIEGFELGRDALAIARRYPGANTVADTDLGDADGFSKESNIAASGIKQICHTGALVGATSDTWICGFAFRSSTSNGVNPSGVGDTGVAFGNTDGEQLRLKFLDASESGPDKTYFKAQILRGATVLATSNESFSALGEYEDWVYFELKVNIHNSTGSFSMRAWSRKQQNGIQTLTWDSATTGLDTQNQSSTGVDRFEFNYGGASASSAGGVFDDIYVCDDAGSKNNDFLGPFFVEGHAVEGDGDTTQWVLSGGAASTEDAWNEPIASVEDDKRLRSDTTGEVHLATVANGADLGDVTIHGVKFAAYSRMETTGSLVVSNRWRKTTGVPAETNSGSQTVSSTSVTCHSQVEEDDPNTGTDWVQADIDGLQVGVHRS